MRSRSEYAVALLSTARQMFVANLKAITLDEALAAAGGYRSVLGTLKHTAAWSHVYASYAFESPPRHWVAVDWPRGLRDTIEPNSAYLEEVQGWFVSAAEWWQSALAGLPDEAFDEARPCHWGGTAPLFDIVIMVANHWTYHAGEINQILAITRGEAWEYSEEVEENHISTAGHRLRPDWMSDEQAARYEAYIARRDAELHPT